MMSEAQVRVAPADEAELLGVLTYFYRHLDANEIDSVAALMHPQGLWLRQGRELRTRDDIADALSERDPRLHIFHLLTSVTFEARSSNHVGYSGYLTVVRSYADPGQGVRMAPHGAQSLHVCKGEFRRADGLWRISDMDAGPPRLLLDITGERDAASHL